MSKKNDLLRRLRGALYRFVHDVRGMSTVEYVILLVVLVVGAVQVWQRIGGHVKDGLGAAEGELEQLKNEN